MSDTNCSMMSMRQAKDRYLTLLAKEHRIHRDLLKRTGTVTVTLVDTVPDGEDFLFAVVLVPRCGMDYHP